MDINESIACPGQWQNACVTCFAIINVHTWNNCPEKLLITEIEHAELVPYICDKDQVK